MSEHECEWKRNRDGHPNLPFKCVVEGCDKLLWSSEAEAMLNSYKPMFLTIQNIIQHSDFTKGHILKLLHEAYTKAVQE